MPPGPRLGVSVRPMPTRRGCSSRRSTPSYSSSSISLTITKRVRVYELLSTHLDAAEVRELAHAIRTTVGGPKFGAAPLRDDLVRTAALSRHDGDSAYPDRCSSYWRSHRSAPRNPVHPHQTPLLRFLAPPDGCEVDRYDRAAIVCRTRGGAWPARYRGRWLVPGCSGVSSSYPSTRTTDVGWDPASAERTNSGTSGSGARKSSTTVFAARGEADVADTHRTTETMPMTKATSVTTTVAASPTALEPESQGMSPRPTHGRVGDCVGAGSPWGRARCGEL